MNVGSKSQVWPLLISIIPMAFLSACEKIPGADAHQIKQAQELAARELFDPFSAQYLNGVTIDYVSSMQGSGFTFKNPNATGGCGCGSSFNA